MKREATAADLAPYRTLTTKLPRASEISVEEPRKTDTPRRLPQSAPVDVCIYKYTDQASDLWQLFAGKDDVPLFQVQVSHAAQHSITFSMRGALCS